MKRLFCLILALLLAVPCLAFCEQAEEIETIVTIVTAVTAVMVIVVMVASESVAREVSLGVVRMATVVLTPCAVVVSMATVARTLCARCARMVLTFIAPSGPMVLEPKAMVKDATQDVVAPSPSMVHSLARTRSARYSKAAAMAGNAATLRPRKKRRSKF